MYNRPVLDYLLSQELIFLESIADDMDYTSKNSYKIKGLTEIFENFEQTPLCHNNSDEKLDAAANCDNYIKVLASLGFYVSATYLIEEIRVKKYFYLLPYSQTELNITHKLDFFNNIDMHTDMNFILINLIYPYIDSEREICINKMIETIGTQRKLYITASSKTKAFGREVEQEPSIIFDSILN